MKYNPRMICTCGTSVHKGEAQVLHANEWHSKDMPADWKMVTEAEHEAAGWNTEGFPAFVTC
ncbi:hypothetical protein ACFQ77_41510 [Streptomyces virginiae]|uniref:hypothetical protein n=1 Tax=Streptomyces virginiae TaxID=1961 RepID=UPI00367FD5F0